MTWTKIAKSNDSLDFPKVEKTGVIQLPLLQELPRIWEIRGDKLRHGCLRGDFASRRVTTEELVARLKEMGARYCRFFHRVSNPFAFFTYPPKNIPDETSGELLFVAPLFLNDVEQVEQVERQDLLQDELLTYLRSQGLNLELFPE